MRQSLAPPPIPRQRSSSGIEQYADVSKHLLLGRCLPENLLAAVAPLSLVYPEEAVDARRAELLKGLRAGCAGISAFLPDQYQHFPAPEECIIPSQRLGRVAVQRPGRQPLEIVVPESYSQPQGPNPQLEHGVGHYVYDPLSASWYLIQRWGQDQDRSLVNALSRPSEIIKPFKKWREASRLAGEKHRQLQQLTLPSAPNNSFTAASEELLAQARKR